MSIYSDMLFSKDTRRIPIKDVRPGDRVFVPFLTVAPSGAEPGPGCLQWMRESRGLFPARVFMRHSDKARENTHVHYWQQMAVPGPLVQPRESFVSVWRENWNEVKTPKTRQDESSRLTLDEAWAVVGDRR
ncbi:hypothetical protein [Streptomyces nigrescens]|uniref:hypothetical protein n=1 Tax=Streptomyces nigrescens TaxID=1920 RepID=UPI00381DEBE1